MFKRADSFRRVWQQKVLRRDSRLGDVRVWCFTNTRYTASKARNDTFCKSRKLFHRRQNRILCHNRTKDKREMASLQNKRTSAIVCHAWTLHNTAACLGSKESRNLHSNVQKSLTSGYFQVPSIKYEAWFIAFEFWRWSISYLMAPRCIPKIHA